MKPYRVLFARDALEELALAKRWYNKKSKGLGHKLQSEVAETIRMIKRNPFFEPVQYEGIRIAGCKNFPYSLHYQVNEGQRTVLVTIIIHQHRKPFWLPDISDKDEDE
jgi:mRNA-degrading endonuclease RelE of RelBE toxin-antitoxin system